VNPRLQRRVQRYGWDLAANDYESLWQEQLEPARAAVLAAAALAPGQQVLDIACGTGLVTLQAARAVGPQGRVVGIDVAGQMLEVARRRSVLLGLSNVILERMDAESLELPDSSFDVVLCSLGLMYMPDPLQALSQMRRVLRPGGRLVVAVWGERSRCGWAPVFEIVDAEVSSDVCPLFFCLGQSDALARLCSDTKLEIVEHHRLASALTYIDAEEACDAAFIGGPVALAWSRFDEETRKRVRSRYVQAIAPWKCGSGYQVPGEFVIVAARALSLQPPERFPAAVP
jgi:ubiquinone/menaquinone biosynthesis C-methylase UbiE